MPRHARLFQALLLTVVLMLAACAGNGPGGPPDSTAPPTALAELELLPRPEGVDPQVWRTLKSTLADLLAAQPRQSAAAPQIATCRVDDLTAGEGSEWGKAAFTWTYRNAGDYNQDGMVTVNDITPVGVHFGKGADAADWQVAQVADGNRDGLITVSDITPIGQNFQATVTGYVLQATTTPRDEGSWTELAQALLADATPPDGGGLLTLTTEVDLIEVPYYRVAPFDGDATATGIGGDPLALVTSEGGTFEFLDGAATLTVPEDGINFFDDFAGIVVHAPLNYPADARLVPGTVVEVRPVDYEFEEPFELAVAYDPAKLPSAAADAGLKFYQAGADDWQLVPDSFATTTDHMLHGNLSTGGTFGGMLVPVGDWNIYEGNFTINTAAALTEFSQYDAISGTLTITGNELTDLAGLEDLAWVGGSLIVDRCSGIGAVDTCEALTQILGDLDVCNHDDNLATVEFPALAQIGGRLTLLRARQLTTLNLPALTTIGRGILIENCDVLPTLAGLSSVESPPEGWETGDEFTVRIAYDHGLTSLTGLEGIGPAVSNLEITGNNALTSLAGIGGITHVYDDGGVTGRYKIEDNDMLTTLTGASIVHASHSIVIWYNDNLVSLTGLEHVTVTSTVDIEYSNSLENLQGLSSLAQVDFLCIRHNPHLLTLDGLGPVAAVNRVLDIFDNPELLEIDALNRLLTIDESDLRIRHNYALENVDGLSSLTTIGQSILIEENYALANLDGLSGLTMIGAYTLPGTGDHYSSITLKNNWALSDVSGLSGLMAVPSTGYVVNGSFIVTGNVCKGSAEALVAGWGGASAVKGVIDIQG
ncbi:hypothetical protein JW859_04485 [bacterium]|nr:hypothetical protein [bacterium]